MRGDDLFPRTRRLSGVVAVALAAGTGVAFTSGSSAPPPTGQTLDIQLLSFNDFHGNLEPPAGLQRPHHHRPPSTAGQARPT